MTEQEQLRRLDLIRSLRAAADYYESHTQLPAPWSGVDISVFADDREELLNLRRAMGEVAKVGSGDYLGLRKQFGDLVRINVYASKSLTCKRVKVGEKVIPATPERVVPAAPERIEDIYEWDCGDGILASNEEPTAEPVTTQG